MSIFEEYGNEAIKRVVIIADGPHNDSSIGPAGNPTRKPIHHE